MALLTAMATLLAVVADATPAVTLPGGGIYAPSVALLNIVATMNTEYSGSQHHEFIDPFSAQSGCGNPKLGPVLGGIDLVALYEDPTKAPINGSAQFADDALGGYVFRFSTQVAPTTT